jgi:hypothetical protein
VYHVYVNIVHTCVFGSSILDVSDDHVCQVSAYWMHISIEDTGLFKLIEHLQIQNVKLADLDRTDQNICIIFKSCRVSSKQKD